MKSFFQLKENLETDVQLDEKFSWNDVNDALTKANYMRGKPSEIEKVAAKFKYKSGNDKNFSLADVKKNLSAAGIDAARQHNVMKHMKEEVELDEKFSPKEIKMAIGIASDKRYAKGNMTGAVKAIEKIAKGLSNHKQVAAVLKRQNESVELGEAFDKEKFQSAEAELVKYAKAHGGMDKRDFLEVAKMLGQIGRINILQAGQILAKLNRKLSNMDTDPRDKVYSILKQKKLMESVELEEAPLKMKMRDMKKAVADMVLDADDKQLMKIARMLGKKLYFDNKGNPIMEAPEDDEPASPDEKSMALKQAKFIQYVGEEIEEYIENNQKFPEWMQNKLSGLHEKAMSVHAAMGGDYGDDMDEATVNTADIQKKKNMSKSDKDKLLKLRKMLDKEKRK